MKNKCSKYKKAMTLKCKMEGERRGSNRKRKQDKNFEKSFAGMIKQNQNVRLKVSRKQKKTKKEVSERKGE